MSDACCALKGDPFSANREEEKPAKRREKREGQVQPQLLRAGEVAGWLLRLKAKWSGPMLRPCLEVILMKVLARSRPRSI